MAFDVISPDGFSISFSDTWETIEAAETAFEEWRNNFGQQGYYSSTSKGRIPLSELKEHCKLIELHE